MKLIKDGKEILELTVSQIKVLKHDLSSTGLENDLARRVKYWIESPVDKLAEKLYLSMVSELRKKKEQTIPASKTKALFRHTDLFPSSMGFVDLKGISCSIARISFEISTEYRKVWRKLLENKFKEKDAAKAKPLEDLFLEERMKWILIHKYERCLERLKRTWLPLLRVRGIESIPVDDEELCNLIFSQPDYKDRDAREEENNE